MAERAATCGGCASVSGCATGSLATHARINMMAVRALNRCGAKVGDRVIVTMPEGNVLHLSLHVYAVPLAGLLAGAFIAAWAGLSDGLVALGALAGLGSGFLYAGLFSRRHAGDRNFEPVIVRCITGPVSPAVAPPSNLAA